MPSLIGCLLAAAALAAAQDAPPVPPQPPAAASPLAEPAPAAAPAPSSDRLKLNEDQPKAQEKLRKAQEKALKTQKDLQVKLKDKLDKDLQTKAQEKLMEVQQKALAQKDLQVKLKDKLDKDLQAKAQEKLMESQDKLAQAQRDFGAFSSYYGSPQSAYGQPSPFGHYGSLDLLAQAGAFGSGVGSGVGSGAGFFPNSNSYEQGLLDLDQRHWDAALQAFAKASGSGADRADGALYWKAYSLNKLGRRDEALAAIADLRKSYASSRWLDDASALELEVKQANGQPVSPDSQSGDDLKLLAINGLMQSDPEHAIPALEGLLKSAQSPAVKGRVLFVLAQSDSPKARLLLEQVARSANPDLQVEAIRYLAQRASGQLSGGGRAKVGFVAAMGALRAGGRANGAASPSADSQAEADNAQLFSEIYNSTNDVNVKRQIIVSLALSHESDRLLQIAKNEKSADLRRQAVATMGNIPMSDALVSMYGSEQDKDVKRAIVNSLASQNNVKQLVAVARAEKDRDMVVYIVGRLANMKSPEAADYLMEILKK
jgi:hypothetical protein